MYSDYDFHGKLMIGKTSAVATTGTSYDLVAGKIGLFDSKSLAVVTAANAGSHPVAYLAQGSFYPADKIGPFHGGYQQSIKSPGESGIDAKRVTRFYKTVPSAEAKQKVRFFWKGGAADPGPRYECGKTYFLRLELKGEDILRTLNRHFYKHYGVFTGCCANNCSVGCTGDPVDPALIMLAYANKINTDPVASKFVTASPVYKGTSNAITVVDGSYTSPTDVTTVVAGLEITVTYSDTVFSGDCNFSPGDYIHRDPITILASAVDEDGDPCTAGISMDAAGGVNFTEVTAAAFPKGLGEDVLRDYIFSMQHLGVEYYTDARWRSINNDTATTAVDRTATYNRYFILYSVPQRSNPENTFSKDQYLLCLAIDSANTALVTSFEALMAAWLTANNPAVALEVLP